VRTAAILPALAIAAGISSGPAARAADARPAGGRAVEVHWIVAAATDGVPGGRELRMRIPRDYVQNIHRDPRGAGEKTRGVRNNGILAVSLEALLPNFSPRLPALEPPQVTPEERRQFYERQLIIDLKASFRSGRVSRETYASQARRGTVYRLPDLHDLERYRRMGCTAASAFDAATAEIPRTEPPGGCRPAAEDEYMVGQEGDLAVLLSCPGPGGRCSMQTWFQGFWLVEVGFPHSQLESWKGVRRQVVQLLSQFVVG
jgi:hypothetical protein